jgi:hypothetical protein
LTAPATAYYLRGDQCPRCMTVMEPAERFREPQATARKKTQDPKVRPQTSAA